MSTKEAEQHAWNTVVEKMDFLSDLMSAQAEQKTVENASAALNEAISRYEPLLAKRMAEEKA